MKNAHPQNTKMSATVTSSILKSRLHKSKLNKFAFKQHGIFDNYVNKEILRKLLTTRSRMNFRVEKSMNYCELINHAYALAASLPELGIEQDIATMNTNELAGLISYLLRIKGGK